MSWQHIGTIVPLMSRDYCRLLKDTPPNYYSRMAKSFRSALIESLKKPGALSLRQIAERAGVSYEQLKKVKQREDATTNVDDARKVANALGLSLDEFLDDNLTEARAAVVARYNLLAKAERDYLQAIEDARRDETPSADE